MLQFIEGCIGASVSVGHNGIGASVATHLTETFLAYVYFEASTQKDTSLLLFRLWQVYYNFLQNTTILNLWYDNADATWQQCCPCPLAQGSYRNAESTEHGNYFVLMSLFFILSLRGNRSFIVLFAAIKIHQLSTINLNCYLLYP